jgi:lipoprotein-anchoring transpeptidase ErfK/SrfK
MLPRTSAALALHLLFAVPAAAETLRIEIDLSDQRMIVLSDGRILHVWPVSTARVGKCTPKGTFTPQRLVRMHYSTLYDNAPMPWSIFFSGNYAIHGTTQVDRLGTPASAGCVRLAPENAEILYGEVRAAGLSETRIAIAD